MSDRKPCPLHTTGSGPCYCQYRKDSDDIYHAPEDVTQNVVDVCKILAARRGGPVTAYRAMQIRQANAAFIRSRIPMLYGANQARAYETLKNLRR